MGEKHKGAWQSLRVMCETIINSKGKQTNNEKNLKEALEKLHKAKLTVLQINLLIDLIVDAYRIGREREHKEKPDA